MQSCLIYNLTLNHFLKMVVSVCNLYLLNHLLRETLWCKVSIFCFWPKTMFWTLLVNFWLTSVRSFVACDILVVLFIRGVKKLWNHRNIFEWLQAKIKILYKFTQLFTYLLVCDIVFSNNFKAGFISKGSL